MSVSQFIKDVASEISRKIQPHISAETTVAAVTADDTKQFLRNAEAILKAIHADIEEVHLKLIAQISVPSVDKLISECEDALISINSISLKIGIVLLWDVSKFQKISTALQSDCREFFNKLQLLCADDNEQLTAFFTRIVNIVESFKNSVSTLIFQVL